MYLGFYEVKLNSKNQLAVPSKLLHKTGVKLIITSWFENSLVVLDEKEGFKFLGKNLGSSTTLLPESRDLQRFFYANAVEVVVDKKGRFVLPKKLKEFAQIKGSAVFLGLGNYIELWDSEIYKNYGEIRSAQIKQTAVAHYERIKRK
jgi:MraZ protein